ncbi:unnamed protein product [Parascedosporium putredinis]|uniref:Uncharacterized protein n=1 Tax=Parascedosporium putredinis TaxID=1442378 RepID=A0A9P1MBC6_9PEZI|nr:unnamed protein product [Parascedosporium putredinis]CAI7995990.1 unnamed protein product [Parascedosporium putredinis]
MDDRLSALEAMREELGNQRLQELPLEDQPRHAIMAGQFEDSDAAAVRGLDDLGDHGSMPATLKIIACSWSFLVEMGCRRKRGKAKSRSAERWSSRCYIREYLQKDAARLEDKKPASNDQFAPLVANLYSRHKSPTPTANSNEKREVVLFQIPANLHVSELKRSPCQVIGLVRNERETRFEIKLESGNSKSHNILDLLARQRKDQVCSLNFRTQDNEIVHYILTFESMAGASFFVFSLDNFGDATRAKLNERLKRFDLTEAGFPAVEQEADGSAKDNMKPLDVGMPGYRTFTPVLSKNTASLLGGLELGSGTSGLGQDTRRDKSDRLTYSVEKLKSLESGAIESSSNVKAVCSQIRSPTPIRDAEASSPLAYPAPDASAGPGVDRGLDEAERIRKQMMAQVKWLTGQGPK